MNRQKLAVMIGLFFLTLLGCAGPGGHNKWLRTSNFNSLRNASELGLNSLESIKREADNSVQVKASPTELKKRFGPDNLSRWSETDTRNHFIPHAGITLEMLNAGLRTCIGNQNYYAYVLDITQYTDREVGNFLKNKLSFEVIKIKEGFKYWAIFVYNEYNEFLHFEWSESPIHTKTVEKDRLGPLGNMGDIIEKPKIGF